VNGLRAAIRNGFWEWFKNETAEIICLQEVKAAQAQIGELPDYANGFAIHWNAARKPGYSGVVSFSRIPEIQTRMGFGVDEFDSEGRVILQEFEKFYLYNIYFPNGQRDQERLDYKLRFYDAFLTYAQELRKAGKAVIFCGDVNTAHQEIDLKNPKANEGNSGFLPIERAWMDKMIAAGYVDTFRMFNQQPDQYSWWTYRMNARERNIGWRIDYFFIDQEHKNLVEDAFILPQVMGSDHCPVGIELKL
jgi:exodeoxyribonuclease-3